MEQRTIPAVVMTHAGRFHADDVFSTALLKILRPDVQVHRAFQVPEDFDGIVYDIGGGEFDHHQQDAEVRDNDIPYAAFGLLWRAFGQQVFERELNAEQAAEEAQKFDEKFVQPLDEDDNKGTGNRIGSLISLFNPNWDDPDVNNEASQNACFDQAVEFALTIFTNKLENLFSNRRAMAVVRESLSQAQDGVVVLPRYAPWKSTLMDTDVDFVVYPSQRGGFCAQIVPSADDEHETIRFPEAWAGKPSEELPRLSGVETLHFCHNGRFMISTTTQEDAVKACQIAREKAESEKENN